MNKQNYYKLFEEDCDKCVIKSTNKQDLILFIDENGDKTKFYTIYKIKCNISVWRKLMNCKFNNGDLIFTYVIIFYDKDTNKWNYNKVY